MKAENIKFKAKRLDNKEWVKGYFYQECGNAYIIENRQKESKLNRNLTYQVDPYTVCQFTGLKDDNGKEIWEGDILFRDGKPQIKEEVKFHKGSFCLGHLPLESLVYYPFDVVQNFVSLGSKFDRKEGEK